MRREPAHLQDLQQVVVLAVRVAADVDGRVDLQQDGLVEENLRASPPVARGARRARGGGRGGRPTLRDSRQIHMRSSSGRWTYASRERRR